MSDACDYEPSDGAGREVNRAARSLGEKLAQGEIAKFVKEFNSSHAVKKLLPDVKITSTSELRFHDGSEKGDFIYGVACTDPSDVHLMDLDAEHDPSAFRDMGTIIIDVNAEEYVTKAFDMLHAGADVSTVNSYFTELKANIQPKRANAIVEDFNRRKSGLLSDYMAHFVENGDESHIKISRLSNT